MAKIRSGLKLVIIYFVLTFRNRVFVWAYSRAYRFAVRVVLHNLSRIEGVKSIYLSGSSAREEVFYGLSDIDFKVFVEGRKNAQKHDEIMALFNRLRRFFPMLGPADEKGVYFIEDFPGEWGRYPLVRHLFHEIHFKNSRIWGEHAIPDLPEPEGLDLILGYTWRVGDWQEKMFSLYLRGKRLNTIQKRYLAYKAVADVCHLCLRLGNGDYSYRGRAAVIEDFLGSLDEPCRNTALHLLGEQKHSFVKGYAGEEEVYRLFREVTGCFSAKADEMAPGRRLGYGLPDWFSEIEDGQVVSLERYSGELRNAGIPVAGCYSLPDTYVPASPLGIPGLSGRIMLLLAERPLSVEEIRKLSVWQAGERERSDSTGTGNIPELCYVGEIPGMIYCIDTDLTEYWFRTPLTDPALFRWLARLRGDEGMVFSTYLDLLAVRIGENLKVVADLIDSGKINRLDGATFQNLFAGTLRNSLAILNRGGKRRTKGGGGVPEPSPSVESGLEDYPSLWRFAEKWRSVNSSAEMGSLRLTRMRRKATMFLQVLLRITGFSSEEIGDVETIVAYFSSVPDEEKMAISVVIITRNRASKLRRCLDSLAAQKRSADEVVLVDNNSSDDTREVAESSSACLPLKYVLEPEIGIPIARNRGIEAANGEIIAFLDDDAAASPAWLEAIEIAFLQDPETGIVGGSISHLDTGRNDLVEKYFSLLSEVTG